MPDPEFYISFDIEADGDYPGKYSMLSLGAVVCARRERNSFVRMNLDDHRNQFYMTIKPVTEHFVPRAAEVAKEGGADRNELLVSGASPYTVMPMFSSWVEKMVDYSRPVGVCFPSWDIQWLNYYLWEYTGKTPFGFSGYIDMKSMYIGKYDALWINSTKRNMPKRLKSKRPHTHNALDDAIEQAELFCNIVEDQYVNGL